MVSKNKLVFFQAGLGTGGATRSNLKIAEGLANKGYKVDLVHGWGNDEAKKLVPSNIVDVDLGSKSAIKSLIPLIKYIRANKPKIIISAALQNNIVVSFAKILSRVEFKIVLTDRVAPSLEIKNRTRLIYKFLPQLMRILYPRANRLVAVSKANVEDVLSIVPKAKDKMRVIYNPAITKEKFEKSQRSIFHPWVNTDIPLIVGLGRLERQKDFLTLIQAFAKVRDERECRLLIIGEGVERNNLEQLICQLGLGNSVGLPGFIANPYPYLRHADLFVLSSAWEGLPNVLLEAMMCGTSVVSTNCKSGPDEILESGTIAPLVPVADPEKMAATILCVLNNPQPAEKLIRRANMFNETQSITQYESLIEELLDE